MNFAHFLCKSGNTLMAAELIMEAATCPQTYPQILWTTGAGR
jgi:hypothetical protein